MVPPLCMAGAAEKELRPHLRWRRRPFSPSFLKPAIGGLSVSSPTLGAGELDRGVPGPPSPYCLYSFSFFPFCWKDAVLREGAVRKEARVAEVL